MSALSEQPVRLTWDEYVTFEEVRSERRVGAGVLELAGAAVEWSQVWSDVEADASTG